MLITVLCSFVVLLLLYLVYHNHRKLDYWTKKNVPHLKPMLFFGNYKNYVLLKEIPGVVLQQICEKFPEEPYIGAYYGPNPTLIVQDPELIKLVVTKDFYYFNGRESSDYFENENLTQNVFFACCNKWKVLRQNLSPMFTSAKMKNMFHLIKKCSNVLEEVLEEKVYASNTVPINEVMKAFTMDCVGSCSFGIDTSVMNKPVNNPFKKIGEAIFEKSTSRGLRNVMRSVWPKMFYSLGFKLFSIEISDFFVKLLTDVFESRQYKPSLRNDMVDIVLTLTNNKCISGDSIPDFKTGEVKKTKMEVTNQMLAAQCMAFFGAGFETSATTLSFTLYELARNPKVQERALQDVDAYIERNYNQLDYNVINEVPYLEACIDEALRIYPVLSSLSREVMADYTFPTGLRVEKGTRIHIPVFHLQRHPKYFPDPMVYRPERFLGVEKLKVDPYVYMPFGGGPRLCIGMRFAKMQMLAGLVTLLKNYRVELDSSTPQKIEFDPHLLVTAPLNPINIKLIPRKLKQL